MIWRILCHIQCKGVNRKAKISKEKVQCGADHNTTNNSPGKKYSKNWKVCTQLVKEGICSSEINRSYHGNNRETKVNYINKYTILVNRFLFIIYLNRGFLWKTGEYIDSLITSLFRLYDTDDCVIFSPWTISSILRAQRIW